MLELIEDLGMLYPTKTAKRKVRYGLYKCSCGGEFKTQIQRIKNGQTKSCGCYRKEAVKKRKTSHGLSRHKLYPVWLGMIQRTTNKKLQNYKYYGEKGINVCNEWKNDFKAFYDWSKNNGYSEGLSIDRINNDGNYEPSNCRWVTKNIQARNTRKIFSNNSSGFRGVRPKNNKFESSIGVDKKHIHLGYFKTAELAVKTRDEYITKNNLEHTKNIN